MRAIGILHIIFLSLLLFTIAPGKAQSRGTKPIYRIEFKEGAKTTTVEGTVSPPRTVGPDMTNEGSERYTLNVRAGQSFSMVISSDNHQAGFSVEKPYHAGSNFEFVTKGGVQRWSGRLTESGDYMIIVFPLDRESVSRFKLRITLR